MFPEAIKRAYLQHEGDKTALNCKIFEKEMHYWGAYNSNSETYSGLFKSVLEGGTLSDFVDKVKQRRGRFIGMDLCGQGDFLEELGVSKGLSVCLGHDYTRCGLPSETLDKFDGNLMKEEVWEKIDNWMGTYGNPDLIVCAAEGGAEALWGWGKWNELKGFHEYSRACFFILLRKMTEILAEGGILLMDFRHCDISFSLWLEGKGQRMFNKLPGNTSVMIDTDIRVLKVTKARGLSTSTDRTQREQK